MVLGDLLYRLWNYTTNNNTNNTNNNLEGFDDATTIQNKKELSDVRKNEDQLNRKVSAYALAHKNLMEKTQTYLQSNRTVGKNIYAISVDKPENVTPTWLGCYASNNAADGLSYQSDMGSSATIDTCKMRAADLGYSAFSLRNDNSTSAGGIKCYVGNNISTAQSQGLSTKSVVSYSFSKMDGANTGSLLLNGQIGVYKDTPLNGVQTDLTAVPNCDMTIGGLINSGNAVASWGVNCSGQPASSAPQPISPPPPTKIMPVGYSLSANMDARGNDITNLPSGTSIADLAAACNANEKCAGFNSNGWIKSAISSTNQYTIQGTNLYLKNVAASANSASSANSNASASASSANGGANSVSGSANSSILNKVSTSITNFLGSRINLSALFVKPWVLVGVQPGSVTSITQFNDGTIVGVGMSSDIYTRPNLTTGWQYAGTNTCCVKGIIQLLDGSILGIGMDNNLYTKQTITASWVLLSNSCCVISICQLQNGVFLACGTDNFLYTRQSLLPTVPWVKITCPTSCCVKSVSQAIDGTILGVGMDNYVYSKKDLSSPWQKIDNSCCVQAIIQLKNGTILGVGSDNNLYTK